MRLIAHRGLVKGDLKENTISAFKAALNNNKYKGIELDIRVTKDNVIICYHNMMYKGKLIKNILYKEISKENVPKLLDVLKINTNKIIMIEIKDFNIDIKKLAKLLNKYKFRNLYISSFNNKVLLKLKPYLKNIKVGVLNYVINSLENYKVFDFVAIINYLITDELVYYFKINNIQLFSYAIKNIDSAKYKEVYYIVDDKILKNI